MYFGADSVTGSVDQCHSGLRYILNGGPKCEAATTQVSAREADSSNRAELTVTFATAVRDCTVLGIPRRRLQVYVSAGVLLSGQQRHPAVLQRVRGREGSRQREPHQIPVSSPPPKFDVVGHSRVHHGIYLFKIYPKP